MRTVVLTLTLALSTFVAAGSAGRPVPERPVQRVNTSLDFGDFTSAAQWTYPAVTTGRLPAVLLIHGSTPADMNFTVTGPDGQPLSHIFADLSEGLSRQGIAVLRYNKHYVSGPGKVDYQSFYGKADLNTFLSDAEVALKAMKANPRIDPQRIYVYGWSEGSTVAAALAVKHPELAGLILQGPVTLPWAELFDKQLTDVQLPYLKQVVPGGLTNANLTTAYTGPGGLVALSALSYTLNQESLMAGKYELNLDAFDQNKNETVELETEYLPGTRLVLKYLIETPQAPLNIYSAARALPVTTAQAASLKVPVLVLQGEHDANTPAQYLSVLTDALKVNAVPTTVKLYPGLGHSLGKAASIIGDNFQPIDSQPIIDTARWIKAH